MEIKKRVYGVKTIILVALLSILAGVSLTVGFDLTGPTEAQDFWQEPAPRVGRSSGQAAPVVKTMPGAPDFVDLAGRLSETVVNISTTQVIKDRSMLPFPEFRGPFDDFFGDEFRKFFEEPQREFKKQSLGSGFIINKEGYILTNHHVIENASEIIVTLSEGKKEYNAEIIGQDKNLDIALIRIHADNGLPVAALGDSDPLKIGEWVMAIGNPFGLGGSVTAGIVSQKGRAIGAGPYDNFIQTDASINPGNSGGPLFNTRGEVVGINTAIIAGGQGIGFATPINMVKDVLLQLKEHGSVTRGWIGVSIQELTPELAKTFGLKEPRGALISSVNPGDPADRAGIEAGDIIVSFDGKLIDELNDLPRVVASTAPGSTAAVRVIRNGREKNFTDNAGAGQEAQARRLRGGGYRRRHPGEPRRRGWPQAW
jgi:serine protease Do